MGESATSRRSSYRPPLSRHYSSWMRKKGRYVADYFAGHGGVARSVQKLGLATRASDLRHGVNHDLTCPKVLYKIREDIFGAHVISSMLAPPCATFSAACDRSGILHTAEDPLGLPTLTGADHEKVSAVNRCMRSALRIIRNLEACEVPWILAHPFVSKAWHISRLQRLPRCHMCGSSPQICVSSVAQGVERRH